MNDSLSHVDQEDLKSVFTAIDKKAANNTLDSGLEEILPSEYLRRVCDQEGYSLEKS